jgi:23S rRNA (pseudouridine1915-N3)-methyltransferase
MKLCVVAVGQRVPAWAGAAWDDYAKRFPPELKVELKAVKTEPRGGKTAAQAMAAERQRIEAACPNRPAWWCWTSAAQRSPPRPWPQRLKHWQSLGRTWPS